MPWYFTSTINNILENQPQVEIKFSEKNPSDLSISRNWMEYIEFQCVPGGPGAYDVLRCDLIKQKNTPTKYKVWGQDYHLHRLENSYKELINHLVVSSSPSSQSLSTSQQQCNLCNVSKSALKKAHEQSDAILSALLSKMVEHEQSHIQSEAYNHNIVCEIIRVTLLWTPLFENSTNIIFVRGHASTSGQIMVPHQIPTPIVTTLALPNHAASSTTRGTASSILDDLPDRHISPHAKISSWSSERRPLEKKETFMPDGVGEVLLLRENSTRGEGQGIIKFELLEGMTSNFFAIYTDGTIRTAPDGVLLGYVRHLVLECADACGLKIDDRPIDLEDGKNGLWAETFITSSSRLIYPIQKILIPEYGNNKYESDCCGLHWNTFWEARHQQKEGSDHECKWYQLLKEILKRGGY
jgi:Branched-chain amino acid aminotransferase/4-amino-4-deoxychorismate lyase